MGRTGLGVGLIAMGAGLALNSLLGPLLADIVAYPVSATMLNQTLGLDAFSLLVVAPLSIAVGQLALRDHPAAPALALGPAFYTAYMLVQYVVGPNYLHYSAGLTLHLGLFILGWVLGVNAWSRIAPEYLARHTGRRERMLGTILLVLAGFVFLRYLPALVGSFSRTDLPAESRGDPAMFWTILLLDLGVVVPAAAAAGIYLLAGGSDWARKAGYALVGWFALVGSSVAAMGIVMVIRHDRYASMQMTVVFAAIAVIASAAAVWLYRPLLRRNPPERSVSFN